MAGIRIRVRNLKATILRMKRQKKNVNSAVRAGVEASGLVVRDIARAMAPVDEGDLESAIESKFRKTLKGYRTEIFVSQTATKDSDGKSVFSYAEIIHEELEVGQGGAQGTLKLGPGSVEKDLHSDHRVGGRFLDRALVAKEAELLRELDNTIRAATRSDRKKNFSRLRNFSQLVRGLLTSRS